jgi:signal transduction histidine kinase
MSQANTASSAISEAKAELSADLRRVERLFADFGCNVKRDAKAAIGRARDAHEALCGSASSADDRAPLMIAAAEMLDSVKSEIAARPAEAETLITELESLGLSRLALAREVLRAPDLATMPPAAAFELQLGVLAAFASLRVVSLWTQSDIDGVSCLMHVGDAAPSRAARDLARRLLAGEAVDPRTQRQLIGLSVGRWRMPIAALVASANPVSRDSAMRIVAEAVPMLDAILERDALLSGNAASERALVEASERKLTRLGFDLHDGPIQDVAALAQDLRLFQSQLEMFLARPAEYKLVRARIEDFEAQLSGLETQLRRLSADIHAPALLNRPFDAALRDVVRAFTARSEVEPSLKIDGDVSLLSASQQIALLNVVHEALTNIRVHSHATEVRIDVSVHSDGVDVHVLDNGRGFDVEKTLVRAARNGRLGLVAIYERVRLLGGQCHIDSRPGGPTCISVSLERWEPLLADAASSRVTA